MGKNLGDAIYVIASGGPRDIAKVVGQRGKGEVVAETPSGEKILLYGSAETGQSVYYSVWRREILREAPDITWTKVGV